MLLTPGAGAQANWYVDAATGSDTLHDGRSWDEPFATVHKGLASSNGIFGRVIFVAVGTYPVAPPNTNDPTATYWIPGATELYGGFRIPNESLSARLPADFERTILTGDIDGNSGMSGVITDDAYHVVTANTSTWTIDGFKIVYGNAAGSVLSQSRGGGMTVIVAGGASSTTLKNVTVENCRALVEGGGIYTHRVTNSSWSKVVLRDNVALTPPSTTAGDGGGMYINFPAANFDLFNFVFDGNRASRGGGLFLQVQAETVRFQNCVWTDNGATAGGAVFLGSAGSFNPAGPTFSHCTIAYNTATTPASQIPAGGSAFFRKSNTGNLNISSSILYNNSYTQVLSGGNSTTTPGNFGGNNSLTLVEYSNVELLLPPPMPAWFGMGSISAPPMFTNGRARILTLQASSPCIDAGDDTALLPDTADLDNNGVFGAEFTPLDANLAPREVKILASGPGSEGGNITTTPPTIADMGAFEVQ